MTLDEISAQYKLACDHVDAVSQMERQMKTKHREELVSHGELADAARAQERYWHNRLVKAAGGRYWDSEASEFKR